MGNMSNENPIAKIVDLSPDDDPIVEYPDSPIRSFLDSNIQRQIDDAVSVLKDNEKGAVIPYFKIDGKGDYVARLAVVAKLSDSWSVVTAFEKRAGKPIGLETAAKFTW